MKPEFGREICYRCLREVRKFTREPLFSTLARTIETLHGHFVLAQEIGIAGRVKKPLGIDLVKELYRIVLNIFPELGVETFEKKPCAVIPTPFQVVSQLLQTLNTLWYLWEASFLHQILERSLRTVATSDYAQSFG